MLRFEVFDATGPARSWPLVNAHLLGRDDRPLHGSVDFADGMIVCAPRESRATALALEYDAGPMGCYLLQTCLLSLRDEPYRLNQELARHRIKQYIAKSEEWLMFDPELAGDALDRWEQAREIFVEASVIGDPWQSESRHRDALVAAIDASERLAMAHAQILLHRRFGVKPASRNTFGIRIEPSLDPATAGEIVKRDFDVVVVPTNWRQMQPKRDAIDFAAVDRWMVWARQSGKPIIAGPLLRFLPDSVPEWALPSLRDPAALRDVAWTFMEQVVYRYREMVEIWNVASGLHMNELAPLEAEQRIDLTRRAAVLVRQSRKGARTLIEVVEPFGERVAAHAGSITPWEYLEQVISAGIKADCVGVQVVFGDHHAGRTTRDLMQLSSMLDRFFMLEIPVLISALGAPSHEEDPSGGRWRSGWSAEAQARWITRAVPIALSKPYIASVVWDRLVDGRGMGLPRSTGLLDDAGRAKASLGKFAALRKRLREPLGPLASVVARGGGPSIGAVGMGETETRGAPS
ncbi:MAG: hypothetical protein KF724_11000 [Phycisphaeraceae bacterium]|nr:hypothetical protein [Phycisphaeraceae bacterium]